MSLSLRHPVFALFFLITLSVMGAPGTKPAAPPPFTEAELLQRVRSLNEAYFADFRHPDTHVLYGARLSTKGRWTSPADVLAEKPHPWGYGSRIADTALHCGHVLVALLDAHEARPDPYLKENIARTFAALRFIGSLPETQPKPGKPALEGVVPRGPHPDDPAAWFDDSSMDQHTTYIISLARYANSPHATGEEKKWIRRSLNKVGRRLERNGWSIKRADGVTQAHVGFSWKGLISQHASILLPAVQALYRGTGDEHWLETYETFRTEREERRWKLLHSGDHIKINGHPIYANQGSFRLNALHGFESDPARKAVIHDLLTYIANLQMDRDFPGPFYRKFHAAERWAKVQKDWSWPGAELHGSDVANRLFQPAMLDDSLATLAHVRFPLGGYHMVMMSENADLIRAHLAQIWKMLTTVDLEEIAAAETNYLFTVVALHIYAFHFQKESPVQGKASAPAKAKEAGAARELPIVANAGIGPTIDVEVVGDRCYAIGKGALRVLDISKPRRPKVLGELRGLGNTRQLAVEKGVAYVGSREDGVFIIDVKDPARPKLMTRYDSIEFATGMSVSGSVLFIACRHYGVELVDVTDPEKPAYMSVVRTGEAQSVAIREGILYAGVWGSSEVVIVDVRDPFRPRIIARAPLDGYGDGVDVRGDFLYAATGHHSHETHRKPGDPGFGRGHGLEIFNVSDPANPDFVSRVKFPPLYNIGNDTWGVTVVDDHAIVSDTHNGMFVVNVADASRPRIVGRTLLPEVKGRELRGYVGAIAPIKDHVLVAGGWTDLHVVEAGGLSDAVKQETGKSLISGTAKPGTADNRYRAYVAKGQVHAVGFHDETAVVACGDDGVHVVQLWPEFKLISKTQTEGFATDVSVRGENVFVAEGSGGLSIFQISDDGRLKRRARYRANGRPVKQVETPGSGRHALLQVGANNLHIVDVSEPSAPKLILNDKHHGLLYGDQMLRGLVEGRYAAAFWHVSGIWWYDLTGGADGRPVLSGDNHPERFGASNGLVSFGGKTLVTVRGGYVLLDRKEKRPFKELAIRRVGERRRHLGKPAIFGDRLYMADRAGGLITVADISDPTKPKLVEQFVASGPPGRPQVKRGAMIVPAGREGLLVFDR